MKEYEFSYRIKKRSAVDRTAAENLAKRDSFWDLKRRIYESEHRTISSRRT